MWDLCDMICGKYVGLHVGFMWDMYVGNMWDTYVGFMCLKPSLRVWQDTQNVNVLHSCQGGTPKTPNRIEIFQEKIAVSEINIRHRRALYYAIHQIKTSKLASYIQDLYLYGSYARGDYRFHSSISLNIMCCLA